MSKISLTDICRLRAEVGVVPADHERQRRAAGQVAHLADHRRDVGFAELVGHRLRELVGLLVASGLEHDHGRVLKARRRVGLLAHREAGGLDHLFGDLVGQPGDADDLAAGDRLLLGRVEDRDLDLLGLPLPPPCLPLPPAAGGLVAAEDAEAARQYASGDHRGSEHGEDLARVDR